MASKVFLQWSRVQTAMFLGDHGKIVITLKMIEIKNVKRAALKKKVCKTYPFSEPDLISARRRSPALR